MNKYKSLVKDNVIYGYYQVDGLNLIFFGTKFATKNFLTKNFPYLKFLELNQVHSCDVVQRSSSDKELPTADGHWSEDQDIALMIRTADCVPVIVQGAGSVAALHAGWRGVAGNIVAQLLALKEFKDKSLKFYVGPHIDWKSFEVGNDVAERLLLSDPRGKANSAKPHPDPNKKYIDLDSILEGQIAAPINFIKMDTFTSEQFCSYRREPVNTGRQFSFIARLSRLRDNL